MFYMFKNIFHLNTDKLNKFIDICCEKSGKSRKFIFYDMVKCFLLYKSGYMDYEFFEMYNLSRKDRKTILTRGKNNSYVKKLNPKKYWNMIDDKFLFNEKFRDYLGRDFLKIDKDDFEKFKNFIEDKDEIIVKPLDATCGVGVEKILIKDWDSKKLFKNLIKEKQFLIEEVAKQHKNMSKLHASSINTLRVVTIRNKYGITSIVAAVCRMGTNNKVVDNFHNGGICAPLDIEKGIINDKAVSKDGTLFDIHPTSKVKLVGYQIPEWDKIKELVVDASNEIPELGLIGWDVYVGPKNVGLIEANQYPAYDLYKMIKIPNSVGILPVFKKALKKRK